MVSLQSLEVDFAGVIPQSWGSQPGQQRSNDAWSELIHYAQRNLENSDKHGESLTSYVRDVKLDYSRYFVPEVLTPFYGTEIWEELDEEQRIFLSQVRYAAFYNRVSSLENLACESNSLFAQQLPKNSSNVLRFYVNRETQEEYDHIWAFRNMSRTIELHLFGEPVFDVPGAGFDDHVNIKLFGYMRRLYRWIPKAMAMTTYAIRGLRNATLKTAEETIINSKIVDPNLQHLTRMHFMDEARHTGMSYTTGKCMYDIANRSPLCDFIILRYLKKPQQATHKLKKSGGYQEYIDVRNPIVRPRLLAHPIMRSKAEQIAKFLDSGEVATPFNQEIADRHMMRCRKNLEYMSPDFFAKAEKLLRSQPG
jgi:hypothetical protein